jgi:glycosyltransferase involved in cell wall biosynthesis
MDKARAERYHILFIGHLFPDSLADRILDQPLPPIQTQRFGLALLDALKVGFEGNIEVFSVAPLLDYPVCRLVFAPRAKWKIDNKISATMVPYINIVGFKHLSRFLQTFAFVFKWAFVNRKFKRIIILHGVQSCKIWGTILGQVFTPCKIVPFLTDDLGIPLKWESNLLVKLRHIDVKLMLLGIRKSSGIIAMTPQLAEKLAPTHSPLIIPAIQNLKYNPTLSKGSDLGDKSFTIVYTGRLAENYGINLLLDAFIQANRTDWQLIITGWGDQESIVCNYSLKYPQIKFLGFIKHEELLDLYNKADVLVNPRLTSSALASLSFPSKIVDYLATGKPVISTNLPVLDDIFRKHLILTRSDTPEELIRCLEEVSSWDENQCERWRKQSLEFVNIKLSPDWQGRKIKNYIIK